MEKFKAFAHKMWANPINWQRRLWLALYTVLLLLPFAIAMGLAVAIFAVFYIPYMVVMGGWEGYKLSCGQVFDVVYDPAVEILYLLKAIWDRAWKE